MTYETTSITASSAYSKYVPEWERPVITSLVRELLDRGFYLAIHNGEEYESKRTNKVTSLRPHFGSTGEDSLVVFQKNDDGTFQRLGYFFLIYNNGSVGDPMVVICDYGWSEESTGEVFEKIWQTLSAKYDA